MTTQVRTAARGAWLVMLMTLAMAVALPGVACSAQTATQSTPQTTGQAPTASATNSPPSRGATASQGPAILVLGDSLSAEYGLPRDTGWVNLLRQRLVQRRVDYSVANGSISGDTTSGGLARLPALLTRVKPAIVAVELGGNDALRGIPLDTTTDNLRQIIQRAQAAHARVMLIGMMIPPNYGPDYTQRFHNMYGQLAQQYHIPLVPFLLQGIADKPEMFQADQIHPTVAAQPALLDNVWPILQPLLAPAVKAG